ncbi:MAG: gpW family head-tail joining protein [Geminicoccaceae bacterium]
MPMTDAERLADAEAALHELNLGRSARVFVDQNQERVEFTAANRGALRTYIEELRAKIASSTVGGDGPLRVVL